MNVQPIIDLWIMEPFAYALVDDEGLPSLPPTPRDLYLQIDCAMERDLCPLIVCRPQFMVGDWADFIAAIPEENAVWLYEGGKVLDHENKVRMSDRGNVNLSWLRGIETKKQLTIAMQRGIRFGSGSALMIADPLEIEDTDKYRVRWEFKSGHSSM